jgi:hypothetical protein
MGRIKKKKDSKNKEQKLAWILREWNCSTLEQAIELAKKDQQLHYALREAGIKF